MCGVTWLVWLITSIAARTFSKLSIHAIPGDGAGASFRSRVQRQRVLCAHVHDSRRRLSITRIPYRTEGDRRTAQHDRTCTTPRAFRVDRRVNDPRFVQRPRTRGLSAQLWAIERRLAPSRSQCGARERHPQVELSALVPMRYSRVPPRVGHATPSSPFPDKLPKQHADGIHRCQAGWRHAGVHILLHLRPRPFKASKRVGQPASERSKHRCHFCPSAQAAPLRG